MSSEPRWTREKYAEYGIDSTSTTTWVPATKLGGDWDEQLSSFGKLVQLEGEIKRSWRDEVLSHLPRDMWGRMLRHHGGVPGTEEVEEEEEEEDEEEQVKEEDEEDEQEGEDPDERAIEAMGRWMAENKQRKRDSVTGM